MFFGRKEDFHFIRARLQGQREGSVILLYGERRAGKTSILHQVVNGRLGSRFVPVFVDMQGMVVQNDAELLQALAAIVVEAVAGAGNDAGRHHPESVAGYRDFTALLDDIMRGIEDRQLVILFDEYELIEHKVSQGKISAEIYDYLTSLLERYPHRLSLIFTGSRSFGVSHAWLSLMGKSVARKISFLSAGDAEDLICRPLGDRIVVGPEAIGDLLRLTRGQPFFTQLLCQMMVEVLNEQRMNCVDRNVVRQVLARALENPPPQLIYQWNNLPGPEKLLLAALAALLKTPASYASWESVDRSIQSLPSEYREGLDAPRNRMLLEGLRLDNILDRDQTRYRFTMDLMRHWIQAEHNVWNVLNEIKQAPACSTALPGFDR
jgi:AAA+ ATPase superfamily predicted ATPase